MCLQIQNLQDEKKKSKFCAAFPTPFFSFFNPGRKNNFMSTGVSSEKDCEGHCVFQKIMIHLPLFIRGKCHENTEANDARNVEPNLRKKQNDIDYKLRDQEKRRRDIVRKVRLSRGKIFI